MGEKCDALTEVGDEDEDVEACGAGHGHCVVEIASATQTEGFGWGAFAVFDCDGSVVRGIDCHWRTEFGNSVWQVEAEHKLCVLCKKGGVPFYNAFARAIERGEMILVGFEVLTRAA